MASVGARAASRPRLRHPRRRGFSAPRSAIADLGEDLGEGLTEREVAYLVEQEWARSADDILWRRTKLGLHGGAALKARLEAWLEGAAEARDATRAAAGG